jgi:hypothetical protein
MTDEGAGDGDGQDPLNRTEVGVRGDHDREEGERGEEQLECVRYDQGVDSEDEVDDEGRTCWMGLGGDGVAWVVYSISRGGME